MIRRFIKSFDNFSEDLDFDCKGMTQDEFTAMTDDVIKFLRRSGFNAEPKDKPNSRLTAFRRNIYFPALLFNLKLTGHKEKRFLLKIEAQDQGITYKPEIVNVSGCGFFFPLPVPPDSVLLSMKISALLARTKGRDFYDTMFLWQQADPDYAFLEERTGISDSAQLKQELMEKLENTDLAVKKRDFEHLLFSRQNSDRILRFKEFATEKLQNA